MSRPAAGGAARQGSGTRGPRAEAPVGVPPVGPVPDSSSSKDFQVTAELPDTATSVRGVASWFCSATSRCTRGYPPGTLAAAAGPALRVGDWRGRIVTVCSPRCEKGARRVRVALIDWCQCGGRRVVDLYKSAFARLGDPSRGVLHVEVTWGDGVSTGLPPTDTALHGESE